MNAAALATVATVFAGLDFTTENDAIAALEVESADCETAIETAAARRREIAGELGAMTRPLGLQPGGGDGPRVADALLEGYGASTSASAVVNVAELDRESAGLGLAIAELRRRIEGRKRQVAEIQQAALRRVADAARPLVDSLVGEMREAGARFVQAYVKAEAISLATRSNLMPGQAKELARAMTAPGAFKPFVPHSSRDVPVPDEIARLLGRLDGKGPSLPVQIPVELRLF